MADSYRTLLRTVDQVDGENDGTWGQKVDSTFTILEEAIAGEATINTTGGDTTLSTNNNATDQQRMAILRVTGTLASNANLIVPATNKTYDVINDTSGAFTVTIKVSGQTGVLVPQGGAVRVAVTSAGDCQMVARRDPTNDFEAADRIKLDGIASGAQVNVGTDLTYTAATRTLNSSTGANVVLPIADGSNAGLAPTAGVGDALKVLRVAAGGGYEFASVSVGGGDMNTAVYDPGSVAEQLVGLTATQTLSNKTLAAPSVTGLISITQDGQAIVITENSGSGATASTNGDNVVVNSGNANAGLSILSPTNGVGNIFFGDSGDNDVGGVSYDHTNNFLSLRANGSTTAYVRNSRFGVGESSPDTIFHVTGVDPYARIEDSNGVLGGAISAGILFHAQGNLQGRLGHIGASDGLMRIENMQGNLGLYADTNAAQASSQIDFNVDNVRVGEIRKDATYAVMEVGNDGVTPGAVDIRGNAGSNGARVRWYPGAGDATVTDYIEALIENGVLTFQKADGTDLLQLNEDGGVGVPSGTLVAGSGGISSTGTIAATGAITAATVTATGAISALGFTDDGNNPTTAAQLANKQYVDAQIAALASQGEWVAHPISDASLVSVSGTTFTGIPAGVREVVLIWLDAAPGASTRQQIVLGDSGGLYTSGYESSVADLSAGTSSTTAILLNRLANTNNVDGMARMVKFSGSNTWIVNGVSGDTGISTFKSSISLTGDLDRVRLELQSGGNFAAGACALFWHF